MDNPIETKTIARNSEPIAMLAFGCIHCHKMVFKFSENLMSRNAGHGDILFECPRCGKTTLLTHNDEIKPGGTIMDKLNDTDCLY